MRRSLYLLATILCATPAFAAKPKATLQTVPMPYVFRDERGSNWDIQPDGSVGDGGNDLFDGGGRMSINEQVFGNGQQPQLDTTANELVFAPVTLQGLSVSRRIG